jgi:hypothetical protein
MMIEPLDSASASANSAERRRGANTLVSFTLASLRGSIWVIGSIGGIVNALLMMQSTRPYAASVRSSRLTRESSSVTSATTVSQRPPTATTSSLSSSRRDSVRLAITRSAPIRAASIARQRPSPGPIPETTMTLPVSSGTGAYRSSMEVSWASARPSPGESVN